MNLTAEQIQSNWNELIEYIKEYISEPRKEKLLIFYEKFAERLMLMPAAHKKEYHNAFPGGYIDHVLRVIRCARKQRDLWEEEGCDISTFTHEELIFSALNHDLGKLGDEENDSYIPQTDEWRRKNLGEEYKFNTKLPFSSVPDRGLYLLQSHGIQYTFNEMVAIQTHDGLYDEGNKKYLLSYTPEQKPRTSLPYILHQADLMAARIEFERDWLPLFQEGKSLRDVQKKNVKVGNVPNNSKRLSTKTQALSSIKSNGLKDILNNL
jgi:hypothetical protein